MDIDLITKKILRFEGNRVYTGVLHSSVNSSADSFGDVLPDIMPRFIETLRRLLLSMTPAEQVGYTMGLYTTKIIPEKSFSDTMRIKIELKPKSSVTNTVIS